MQNFDDKQFEADLKRFRPVAPAPLPKARYRTPSSRLVAQVTGMAAAAAMLIGAILWWLARTPDRRLDPRLAEPVVMESWPAVPPLTIGSSNHWLQAALTLDTALDELAVSAKHTPIPNNKQSAFSVLSKENTK